MSPYQKSRLRREIESKKNILKKENTKILAGDRKSTALPYSREWRENIPGPWEQGWHN